MWESDPVRESENSSGVYTVNEKLCHSAAHSFLISRVVLKSSVSAQCAAPNL